MVVLNKEAVEWGSTYKVGCCCCCSLKLVKVDKVYTGARSNITRPLAEECTVFLAK